MWNVIIPGSAQHPGITFPWCSYCAVHVHVSQMSGWFGNGINRFTYGRNQMKYFHLKGNMLIYKAYEFITNYPNIIQEVRRNINLFFFHVLTCFPYYYIKFFSVIIYIFLFYIWYILHVDCEVVWCGIHFLPFPPRPCYQWRNNHRTNWK